uniref:Uncharacterized protein n=1 Tax=Bosea sp. NBC_00436 TaxID=2969620 RepID=A0A9E7ZL68_9HYPH
MTIENHRAAVAQHRAEISKRSAERDAAASAPVDAATAAARIDAEIASAKARFDGFFYLGSATGGFDHVKFNAAFGSDPLAAFATIDPAGLRKAALASVPEGGLSDRDRADRIARASAALAEAEIGEEIALRQLDVLLGGHEPRRPDADPRIMLAPLGELQEAAKPKSGGFLRRAG